MGTSLMGDTYKYDPNYHKFADLLGVDLDQRNSFKVAQKIAFLFDWAAARAKMTDVTSVYREIDRAKSILGVQFIGKTLVDHLYTHARIEVDSQRLEDQRVEVRAQELARQQKLEAMKQEGQDWRKENRRQEREIKQEQNRSETEINKIIEESKNQPQPVDTLVARDVPLPTKISTKIAGF